MKKVRMGILGMGNMGCQYAKMIVEGKIPGMELAAVSRIKSDRVEKVREFLPKDIPVMETMEELFSYKDMDAVLIATPHYAHPQQAIECFQRGLHVLCEKPAGVDTKSVREMNEAADRSGKVFALMFNQRTNLQYQKIREIVQSGKYGELKRVNLIVTDLYRPLSYYSSGSWRGTWATDGGGLLMNQCPHNLDILQWICGIPAKVQAICHEGKWHPIEVEDEVSAYMEFDNGATGIFVASTGEAPGTNRLEIILENAKLVCEDRELKIYELSVNEKEFRFTSRKPFESPKGRWISCDIKAEESSYVGILQNFTNAILSEEPLLAKGQEGLNSLLMANAMYLSSWTGKAVNIPFDEEKFLEEFEKKK
ncbi:Gfo/Idh/MocA family oxidoreductase [Lachnospiraceae bacterium OttesenSCG-928-D06]|nr:Gfo/Idh/MocA family oxidoreductase [Lachnospiraceae bacterium OttesenSCG-928-D06]